MEQLISVKSEYASLEKIEAFIKKETSFDAQQEYDSWEMRTDANEQMEKCVVIKKSNMHGAKVYFTKDNMLKVSYIIPNKMMNAYFGKSQKKYQNIVQIITGKIKDLVLSGSQKTAFEEITKPFSKISV